MKRVNLLSTDWSSSGSKMMTTTGQINSTGSTRTKAFNSRISHLMFLAGVLLITLLTSTSKAKAEGDGTYTVVMANAENCHITVSSEPIAVTNRTFKLVAANGYKLPETLTSVVLDADEANTQISQDEGIDDANEYKYDSSTGEVTISTATVIADQKVITITAAGVELKKVATLATFTYQLATGVPVTVPGFSADDYDENGYTVSELDFSNTVLLAGTVTSLSNATAETPTAVEVAINEKDGTGTATSSLIVTAEDGKTANEYKVNFNFKQAKITQLIAPEAKTLDDKVTSTEDVIKLLDKEVTVVTENTEITALPVSWEYTGAKFSAAANATNRFTWTAAVPATLDANQQTVTGNVIITNAGASSNAQLSALTYTIGSKTEQVTGFDATDNDKAKTYTVPLDGTIAPDAEISVEAEADDIAAIIDGTTTTALSENEATITLTVTPESGDGDARTITINFTRTASTDATLSTLSYKIGESGVDTEVPQFTGQGTSYNVALPYNTEATAEIFVSPVTNSPYATYAVDQAVEPDLPQGASAEATPLKVTLVKGGATLAFTVTAENPENTQKVSVTFTTAKVKITAITAPVAPELKEVLEESAVLKEVQKIENVSVTLENGEVVQWPVSWALKESPFNIVPGGKNTYTWTITTSSYENYDLNEQETSGDIEVVNFVEAYKPETGNEELTINDTKLYNQIGDGKEEIALKSVTVNTNLDALAFEQVVVSGNITINSGKTVNELVLTGTTVDGTLLLNENVPAIALNNATIKEIALASSKKTVITLQAGNNIATITNAGILTLNNAANAKMFSTALNTKTAATPGNKGAVKAVKNTGTFTDNTASIVNVTGDADIAITALPQSQSTTGNNVELSVATATPAKGTIAYQWKKYISSAWVNANGEGNKTATLKVLKTGDGAGTFRCEVKNTNGGAVTTLYTPSVTVTFSDPVKPDPDPVEPTPSTYTVKLPKVEGATFSKGETTSITEGEDFSFTIKLDKDYDQSEPIVKVDNAIYEPDASGNYVIQAIARDITITVTGITKNTTTGIEDTTIDTIRIWSEGNTLYIHTPAAEKVYIVNAVGILQQQFNAPCGDTNIQLRSGFYIVHIGKVSQKVIIR